MTSLTGCSTGCIRGTMDKALADKFSNIIKEIWGIQTEVDRLAHNVIELTALTAERMEGRNGTGGEE